MSDIIKVKVIEKFNKIIVKIGYLDIWKDYLMMNVILENNYYENMVVVNLW